MTATRSPEAGAGQSDHPEILHDAVEAMLATARRLAHEAGIHPVSHPTVPDIQSMISPLPGNLKSSGIAIHFREEDLDETAHGEPTGALYCAAGAGALFSLWVQHVLGKWHVHSARRSFL